jgi:hypothetical protein
MSVGIYSALCRRVFCAWVPRGALALICCVGIAGAQVKLPEVLVRAAKPKPKPATAARVRAAPATAARVRAVPAPATRVTPAERLATQTAALNQGLNTIYPTTGRRRQRSATTRSRRCPKARTPRSRRLCCGFPELPRIRPPVAVSTCATSMPMCRPASMASCFLTASAASALSLIRR